LKKNCHTTLKGQGIIKLDGLRVSAPGGVFFLGVHVSKFL
jgi:hypothetical protein